MNTYSVSSGIYDPSNDYLSFTVAMDAGAYSSIQVYESGGNGVISYSTTSDFIPRLSRGNLGSRSLVELSTSQASMTGYPNYLSWIPGRSISLLSSSDLLTTGTLPVFTSKDSLSDNAFIKSGKLIPSHHYDTPWAPSGRMQISNISVPNTAYINSSTSGLMGLRSRDTDLPFIVARNTEVATTGSFDLYASVLEGCVFKFLLNRNFSNNELNEVGSSLLPERFGTTTTDEKNSLSTLNEWNSIFAINDGCNAGSIFRNGENRDTVFFSEMRNYLNRHWYGKLKDQLWGSAINDTSVSLSSRDPETLKRTISYCFLYFGASDDILNLGRVNYVNPWSYNGVGTQIRWHLGLGAVEASSNQSRYLKKENTLLPTTNKYAYVNKVFGLPPRTSYSNNLTNNLNLISFTGSFGDPNGGAKVRGSY